MKTKQDENPQDSIELKDPEKMEAKDHGQKYRVI